jgi:TolB protein
MKKGLCIFLIISIFLYSQTQVFIKITKNLVEKADIFLILRVERNDFFTKLSETLSQDLKFSGYFNIDGSKFTDDIEKIKKNITTQLILTIGQKKENISVKIEDGLEKNILFENDYKYLKDPRYLSHIICDDIVEKLTGKVGIAKSKIFFTADKTGRKQIYQIDYDGYNLKQITNVDYLVNYPRYLEGKSILFVSYKDGWPKLSKIDILTNKIHPFIAFPGLNACASPCKKTKEIVLVLSVSGDPEIYRANFDGKIIKRLTYNKGIDSSPSFSPDGKEIVFVSDRDGKPQIYLMDKDGYGIRRISYISNYCTSPVFSPDGNFIAYIFSEENRFGIAIYDINTGKTKKISNLQCEEISWAPNSRHIVYSHISKKNSLMVIDIFTKEIRTLLSGDFNCFSPNWVILEEN